MSKVVFGSRAVVTYVLPLADNPIRAIRFWFAIFISVSFGEVWSIECSDEGSMCESRYLLHMCNCAWIVEREHAVMLFTDAIPFLVRRSAHLETHRDIPIL